MRVVIDTCVLVRTLLGSEIGAQVFDAALTGKLTPIWDERLAAEYRTVCAYSKFRFAPARVEFLVRLVEEMGIWAWGSGVRLPVPARDPQDTHVLELAVAGDVDAIVTDDKRGFPLTPVYVFEYLTPEALLRRL